MWGFVYLCCEIVFFLLSSESEVVFLKLKKPQKGDQSENDTAGAFTVKSCIFFFLRALGSHEKTQTIKDFSYNRAQSLLITQSESLHQGPTV